MSNIYYPNNWVVIFFDTDTPHYKILGGWSGGYLHGDSWRMNSGIVRVEKDGDNYKFYGSSGSCYSCHESSYGLRNNNAYVWNGLSKKHGEKVVLMDETTNWLELDWKIS
jgi:hypothetical protein